MSYKVSVIVPVYKVEKYLRKCLDSLVNQTLKEIQIIVVNDGSPDNCQSIIDEYKDKYPNVLALIKPNGGLGDARNFGLDYVEGEYLGFVDSDDYIDVTMYEKMYLKAKELNSDLVVCDLVYTYEDNSKEDMLMAGLGNLNENPNKAGFLSPLFAWNKIYRTTFFKQHNFKYPVGLWYEDIPVTVPCFVIAKNIGYVNEVMVYYLQRNSSIMGSGYSDKMYDIFPALESVYDFLNDNNLFSEFHQEIEYLYIEHLLLYGAFRFLRTPKYSELCNHALDVVNYKFPKWRKNKYIKNLSLKNRVFLYSNNAITLSIWKKIIERR